MSERNEIDELGFWLIKSDWFFRDEWTIGKTCVCCKAGAIEALSFAQLPHRQDCRLFKAFKTLTDGY